MFAAFSITQPGIASLRVDVAAIDLAAAYIGGAHGQARHSPGGDIQIVASLPGLFIGCVEVRQLHGIADEDSATGDVVERRVAIHLLITEAEAMGPLGVSGHQAPGGVVDCAG
ncbi:hypothetical protein D9M71_686540 [compost metagenome]